MTAIDLCNAALQDIGHDRPITAFDVPTDPSAEARRCAVQYPRARRAVFITHPWSCLLVTEATIPLPDITLPPGHEAAFADPSDALLVVSVVDAAGAPVPFSRIGGILYATAAAAQLTYTRDSEDPDQWSPLLLEAIIADLAVRLARTMGASPQIIDYASDAARSAISRAKFADTRASTRTTGTANPYLAARN
jgi:hypothetical protein